MIICGDALIELRKMPDESVHMCCTSPPYWGLRNYGIEGQLGLERTPKEYVAHLVEVFSEVKRVLRKDGTLWLNLGDSYANSGPGSWGNSKKSTLTTGSRKGAWAPGKTIGTTPERDYSGLKPKDLCGIPWRVAFALQADGWWLRQDIIWAKPNPMPESVRDRCTKAHEYIFMLSQSAKYYYDAKAIDEPVADATIIRCSQDVENQSGSSRVPGKTNGPMKAVLKQDGVGKRTYANFNERYFKAEKRVGRHNSETSRRNSRSVWTITTKPFREAHFATFPPEIPERCIKAGCPIGGIVLDPFFGAGTTGMVAKQLGRDFIGIELNQNYCEMAERRIAQTGYQPGLEMGNA